MLLLLVNSCRVGIERELELLSQYQFPTQRANQMVPTSLYNMNTDQKEA